MPRPTPKSLRQRMKRLLGRCTCDRSRPETFDPSCVQHGIGTLAYREREAFLRGPSNYGHHHDPSYTLPHPDAHRVNWGED